MAISNNNIFGDFLKNIEQAYKKRKHSTRFRGFKQAQNLAQILVDLNIIHSFNKDNDYLVIMLHNQVYPIAFKEITLVSSRSKPIIMSYAEITQWKKSNSSGTLILSTSQGVLTLEKALEKKVGGLCICIIV